MTPLSVQTGTTSPSKASPRGAGSGSRSSSPVRPPYSPISPARSPPRQLPAVQPTPAPAQQPAPAAKPHPPQSQPPQPQTQRAQRTFTHNAPNTQFIPQPRPEPITLEDNADAIALRSAITILQLQKKRAAEDIKTLAKIKAQAVADPEGFRDALAAEQLRTAADPLVTPQNLYEADDDEDEDASGDAEMSGAGQGTKWTNFPARQNVVRCPPINWNQYGVVGESLDKLHRDQQRRPTTGAPQKIGADGRVTTSESVRRQEAGIAAPYTPGKDKIERNTKKGKK